MLLGLALGGSWVMLAIAILSSSSSVTLHRLNVRLRRFRLTQLLNVAALLVTLATSSRHIVIRMVAFTLLNQLDNLLSVGQLGVVAL